jgi:TPR repeat protein
VVKVLLLLGVVLVGCEPSRPSTPPEVAARPSSVSPQPAPVKTSCEDSVDKATAREPPTDRFAAFRRSCNEGCGDACDSAGTMLRFAPTRLRDDHAAFELYRKACTARSARGCSNLGLMLRMGRGTDRNYDEAKKAYAAACDAGYAHGCSGLGDMFEYQVDFAPESAEAARHYARACDLGDDVGCAALADLYRTGRGVTADPKQAMQLYLLGCERGSGNGCVGAARMAERGAPSPIGSEELYRRGARINTAQCAKGDPYYCSLLGDAFREGKGVQQDLGRARQLYQYGCSNGMQAGCDGLEQMAPSSAK